MNLYLRTKSRTTCPLDNYSNRDILGVWDAGLCIGATLKPRDWSFITGSQGGGGYKMGGEGGQVKFHPTKMRGGGGAEKVSAMLKGETQKVLG